MSFVPSDSGRVVLDTVLDDIKEGKVASCYLICGDEEYLVNDALDKIINLILSGEKSDFNLFYLNGENEDIGGICESILTPPLIPGKKVIVVRNSQFEDKEDTETLQDVLKDGLPEGNCLILAANYFVDRRKKLFKIVSDIGVALSFSQVKGEKNQKKLLRDTTKEFLAEKGKKLTAGASLALERMTGSDLRQFRGALEKLVIYTGDRSLIEEKDVGAVIERAKEDSIFDLTSALAGKNLKRALLSLNDIQDGGVHYLVILTMVYREIRLLLHAKIFLRSKRLSSFYPEMDYNRFQNSVYPEIKKLADQSGERTGEKSGGFASQHPYVIYKALRNSVRFSFENLVEHLGGLADADLILKTTGKNPRLVLERLLIDITAQAEG